MVKPKRGFFINPIKHSTTTQVFRLFNLEVLNEYFSKLILLSLLAGISIPVGGSLAAVSNFYPNWLNEEWKHGIIAFGGGALVSAVALVLVPEGSQYTSPFWAVTSFLAGGFFFGLIDYLLSKAGGSASQLLAMLLDFIPEAMALGAALVMENGTAVLIAFLIAIQNLPESFNAFREIKSSNNHSSARLLLAFGAIALVGPLSAFVGSEVLSKKTFWLGIVMLFGAGGILFLTFRDVAPQSRLDKHWLPSVGGVIGFAVGLIGHLMSS